MPSLIVPCCTQSATSHIWKLILGVVKLSPTESIAVSLCRNYACRQKQQLPEKKVRKNLQLARTTPARGAEPTLNFFHVNFWTHSQNWPVRVCFRPRVKLSRFFPDRPLFAPNQNPRSAITSPQIGSPATEREIPARNTPYIIAHSRIPNTSNISDAPSG